MHAVEPGGMPGWLQSECRQSKRSGGMPRAYGPAEDWTAEQYWYPNCQLCPEVPE